MNLVKKAVAAALVVAVSSAPAIAADAVVRPANAVPQVNGTLLPQLVSGSRVGRSVAKKQNLLGAPLIAIAIGAVAVTVGTIAITNDDDDNSSPG